MAELDRIAVREPTLPNGHPADETEEYAVWETQSGLHIVNIPSRSAALHRCPTDHSDKAYRRADHGHRLCCRDFSPSRCGDILGLVTRATSRRVQCHNRIVETGKN